MTIIKELFLVFWFFLPAGIANTAPIFAAHIPYLAKFTYPLDFYGKYKDKRIFGNHKTIRGLLSGIPVGILVSLLQVYAYTHIPILHSFIRINYASLNPFLFGTVSALGALGGDAIKSFFKRQFTIAPGKSWFPFDQLDYILGGIFATIWYIHLSLFEYVLLIALWFLLHPLSTFVGYLLKLKKSPI